MDKQQLVEKTTEVLRPFETGNLMHTLQTINLKDIFTNPVVMIVVLALLFFGVIRKSKPVLLTLFSLIGMIVLVRYTMPPPGDEISMKSLIPFALGGVFIGGVIIYFSMIQSD